MMSVVNETAFPFFVIPESEPAADWNGTMAFNPFEPLPTATVNVNEFPEYEMFPNDELFRPSNQPSICFAETTGTPWARADATIASEPEEEALSVCILAVKAP